MGHHLPLYSDGKTTYWVRGQKFFNDNGLRNGKSRAEDYCKINFIPLEEIIRFDSVLECERYEYLLELERQGKISQLTHHLSLPLLPQFINSNGDTIPELRFNSDFTYIENGKKIVEDVKGASLFVENSRFEAVKQIFDFKYKELTYIRVIIKRDKEWVEWHIGEPKKSGKRLKQQSAKIKELKKQLHEQELAENLKNREIKRLNELREKSQTQKLAKKDRERLAYLEEKYKV